MRRTFMALSLLPLGACALLAPATSREVVYFEEWSAQIDVPARAVVADAAAWAKNHPGAPVRVRGYADPEGTPAQIKAISGKRAQAVTDMLVADGVEPARISHVAEGSVKFALDSLESRRVEILLGRP
jgi:outer membrane protein OmpA-like peptidoglycan-associated protein